MRLDSGDESFAKKDQRPMVLWPSIGFTSNRKKKKKLSLSQLGPKIPVDTQTNGPTLAEKEISMRTHNL